MTSEEPEVVICRACIKECLEYKSIYSSGVIMGELTTLAALLNYCTNLDFPEHEDLPSNMCTACISNLAKLYAFKQMVIKSNETLRNQHDELINDSQGFEELFQEVDSNDQQDKQELDHSYVTLTVVEESKLEPDSMHMRNENMDETDDSQPSTESLEEQQLDEIFEHGEEEALCQVVEEVEEEPLEFEESFKVEDDFESETYVVIVQDAPRSATSISASELEEDEHGATVETAEKRKLNMTTEEFVAAKRFRPIKPRIKNSETKPSDPSLQCQVCGKQLSNPNSFRYHMQLHSDATPFLCSLCGEGFKTRNAYEGHMSVHDPNNPNTCELCGKSYRQPSSLRAHMLTHTGEKPFQCDICGKGMTQKSGYKKHMLTHTGEKPHTCDICGRAFRYSSNLISHKRHHTGEKPYDCPLCEKSFSTTEQLKRHTLVHTGEKPFCCEVCNRRFNRRSSLVAHRHIHDSNRTPERKASTPKDIIVVDSPKQVRCVEHY